MVHITVLTFQGTQRKFRLLMSAWIDMCKRKWTWNGYDHEKRDELETGEERRHKVGSFFFVKSFLLLWLKVSQFTNLTIRKINFSLHISIKFLPVMYTFYWNLISEFPAFFCSNKIRYFACRRIQILISIH